jgi:endonuclease G
MRTFAAVLTAWLACLSAAALAQPPPADTLYRDSTHLRWGVAGPKGGRFLDRRWYVVDYRDSCRIPYWSAYRACADSLAGRQQRKESLFKPDPWLPAAVRSTKADYKYSDFDRGHLAPAADFQRSRDAYAATYYLSNMCPQYPRCNSGIWQNLEGQVRSMVLDRGEAWIVTGAAFIEEDGGPADPDTGWWIGEDDQPRVAVPTHLYKAILARDKAGEFSAFAFLVPNRRSWNREQPDQFQLTVRSLETLTGWDFFPELPDSIEAACETVVLPWDWRK